MKVLHLSWLKRSEGELGGVEKFASYLHRALVESGHECEIVSWSDYPGVRSCGNLPNTDKALVLGSWVEEAFDFDVAVSDGYWGLGVSAKIVVPVVHGTWAGFHVAMGTSPWTNAEVRAQHQAFTAPNAFPVACSPASARELEQYHRRQPVKTILHGVDLQQFQPAEGWQKKIPGDAAVVLHAATNAKKGKTILPAIARALGGRFHLAFLNAKSGEEPAAFRRGDIFLHPAKHEGNAYALLEALATALPIVTTRVGLFASIEDGHVGRVLAASATVKDWAQAVQDVWSPDVYHTYSRQARGLAEEIADFQTFKKQWVAFLEALP